MTQIGFFDLPDHLQRLSEAGDPLETMAQAVDFEVFRPVLEEALAYSDGAKGGRPPYDAVAMFKALILAAQNNVSDARMEFLIRDRLSWMRFLGFELGRPTPDENTIRLFREKLMRAGAIRRLFDLFEAQLRGAGYLAMGGQIVDATLVAAPRQRNTAAEKEQIKAGKSAAEIWPDDPAKAAQKDVDAGWTVKTSRPREGTTAERVLAIPVFGSKSHLTIDRRFGFIRSFAVTDAARHEGALLRELVRSDNTASEVWADTAIDPGPTRHGWSPGGGSRAFTRRSRGAGPWRSGRARPTRGNRRCGRASSTSSRTRRRAWTCSSGPLAKRGRRRRSGWPI